VFFIYFLCWRFLLQATQKAYVFSSVGIMKTQFFFSSAGLIMISFVLPFSVCYPEPDQYKADKAQDNKQQDLPELERI